MKTGLQCHTSIFQGQLKTGIIPLLIVIITAIALLLPGCSEGITGASGPCPTCSSSNGIGALTDGDASWGLIGGLQASKAPRLNEEIELDWSIKAVENWTELHAWVQFEYNSIKPGGSYVLTMSEVKNTMLLDGQLEWLGALEENEQKDFKARIRLPEEGKWNVYISFLGKSVMGRDVTLTSEKDKNSAPPTIGPYLKFYISESFSQIGFPKDTSLEISINYLPLGNEPLFGFVDCEKPPKLNEPTSLNWGFGSIRDLENVELSLRFYKMEGLRHNAIPIEKILTNGVASTTLEKITATPSLAGLKTDRSGWRMEVGSLQEIPVSQGATMRAKSLRERLIETIPQKDINITTVKFPSEGDWKVRCVASAYDTDLKQQVTVSSYLNFNVSKGGSTWGWRDRHEAQ